MVVLAIDGTVEGISVALLKDKAVLGEKAEASSATFFTLVHTLLEAHQLQYNDIKAVAVSRGPGSFTGIRFGLAAAYGFTLAGNIPLYGVNTLDVMAFKANVSTQPILMALSTKRGDFYGAQYKPGEYQSENYKIMTVPEVEALASTHQIFAYGEDITLNVPHTVLKISGGSVGAFVHWLLDHNPQALNTAPFYLRPPKVYEGLDLRGPP